MASTQEERLIDVRDASENQFDGVCKKVQE
jgi:hypothetical protein